MIPEQPPRTIYVDENSTSTAPDGSFADPFLAIQDGVDDANPGDLVFVAPGTYVENVIISQGPLYLEGEGPGAAAIIDASAGTTEPNGIRIQQDVDTVVISNFRLEAAHVDDGVVAGVIIYGSSEERGIEICNNVFFGNDAGVAPQDTSPLVVNNTFVNNEYGLYVAAGSQGTYRNNIFKDNTTAAIQVFTSNSTTTDYNLFHGNGSDLTGAAACAPGCMFGVDPMIVAIPGHDFHIMPASPAVDAGTMMLAPKYDFNFEMRPIGPDIDIGADEVHGDDPTPVESCVIPEGPIIYVDSTAGAGTPDGSLAFPYPTIQDAVDAANPGDVIEVAGGVYVENVVISQGPLSIIGGDPGAAAWIDASSSTTEPNGIRIQQDADNIVIVNIGFTGAQIDGASGIIVYGSSAPRGIEICNNVIYDNDRGVSAQNTSSLVVNNTVVMNGIGLSAADSQGLFQNNIVKDNNIGLETFSTTSNFDYNLLHNNSLDIAGPGACMMCISGDPLLINPPGGDFHIDPASPAVDAGTMMRAPTYDFDFEPRPMGPVRNDH